MLRAMMRQSKSGGHGVAAAWRAAGPLIAAGLGAHLVVVALTQFAAPPPMLTAVAATLAFAVSSYLWPWQPREEALPIQWHLLAIGFTLAAITVGATLIGCIHGSGTAFYCEPLVPWRIEIALFGSFVVGFFSTLIHGRRRAKEIYPAVLIALLWIAPFYGFFSASVFLGIGLNSICPDRSLAVVLLTALGMVAGQQIGKGIARLIFAPSERGRGKG